MIRALTRFIAWLRAKYREGLLCPHQTPGCKPGNRCPECYADNIW